MSRKGSTSGSTSVAEVEPVSEKNIGARIALVRGELSQNEFAKSIGSHLSTIGQYERGQRTPVIDLVVKICDQYKIDPEWLLTGRGPMRREEPAAIAAAGSRDLVPAGPVPFQITNLEGRQVEFRPSPELVHLPIMATHVACGPGAIVDSEAVEAVFSASHAWIRRELGANPQDLTLVFTDGDSMAPTLSPGEIVFVDRSKIHSPGDGIWAFRFEEGVMIKRLQFLPGRKIHVTSDNRVYQPFTITPETRKALHLLGRVIASLAIRRV